MKNYEISFKMHDDDSNEIINKTDYIDAESGSQAINIIEDSLFEQGFQFVHDFKVVNESELAPEIDENETLKFSTKEIELTEKENAFMSAHLKLANEGCNAKDVEDLIGDNYSWANLKDLSEKTGFNKYQIAGLVSSLSEKGVIQIDSDEKNLLVIETSWLETLDGKLSII